MRILLKASLSLNCVKKKYMCIYILKEDQVKKKVISLAVGYRSSLIQA